MLVGQERLALPRTSTSARRGPARSATRLHQPASLREALLAGRICAAFPWPSPKPDSARSRRAGSVAGAELLPYLPWPADPFLAS